MTYRVEVEREDAGRWIAEIPMLPGVMMYADTREAVMARVQALALRVIADRLEHGDAQADNLPVRFTAE